MRRDPIPTDAGLRAIYESPEYFKLGRAHSIGYGDYYADEAMYRSYFREKFRALARFRAPPGTLLEIGAAAGYALVEAGMAGWDAHGIEVSPSAVKAARERFGVSIVEGDVYDVAAEPTWDAICAFQVIEHLADVRGALRAIWRALKPGGVLMVTTPDHASWVRRATGCFWSSYRPEHLTYFDARTVRTILAHERFAVCRIRTDAPLRASLRRIAERLAHYYLGTRFDPRFLPDWHVRVWLGDMEVIAAALP